MVMKSKLNDIGYKCVFFILFWITLYFVWNFNRQSLGTAPAEVICFLKKHIVAKEPILGTNLLMHVLYSLSRFFIGLSLAALIGFSLGISSGTCNSINRFLSPGTDVFRYVPPIAWVPLSMILFKDKGPVFIVFLGAFFPIYLSVVKGCTLANQNLLKLAHIAGASHLQKIKMIVIPSSIPFLMHGIKVSIGIGWMCIIAAEMTSFSSKGIGFFTITMYQIGKIDAMFAGMASIGITGFILNSCLHLIKISHYEKGIINA